MIFGSGGYLGSKFTEIYPDAACPKVDIADPHAVAEALDTEQPDVVINAAGKTGRPNIDWCEDHKMETLHSNVTGPLVLLEECQKRGAYLVHLGSGCIYTSDEGHPMTEEDPPNFTGSFYSRTKGWIDQIFKDFDNVLVLRLRMPFDGSDSPRTLINKLRTYDKVLDVKNSMTYIPDLLAAAQKLIAKRCSGLYNIVNPGVLSPYDVMVMYKKVVQPDHEFEKITLDDLLDVVKAERSNCVLTNAKLENEGISMMPTEEALERCFAEILERKVDKTSE